MIVVEPMREEDFDDVLAVLHTVYARDLLSADALRAIREGPGRVDLVARLDGRIVGSAGCQPDRWSPSSGAAFAAAGVLPELRRRGIGTRLAHAVSQHARALGKDALLVGVWEDDNDGLSFVRNRGFEEVARMRVVTLALEELDEVPVPDVPPGVSIERMVDGDALRRELYDVACEVELDVPSVSGAELTVPPFEDWERRSFKTLLPEHSFVARAGGEIIGYATLAHTADPRVAFHEMTAVRRAWRGRGLARALKTAQILSAREAGLRELGAMNETSNAPMRAVNARLGYRPQPAKLSLRGPLLDDAGSVTVGASRS
jgi:GNAT superfamily N-acetyltransferase